MAMPRSISATREGDWHRPAIAVDDIRAPGGERCDQTREPPGLRPDIGVEQDDVSVLGLELGQRSEKICAFLAAQRRQTGDDQFDFQLWVGLGSRSRPRVGRISTGFDDDDQPIGLERLDHQRAQQFFQAGQRSGRR
jgi:hypothetical protein